MDSIGTAVASLEASLADFDLRRGQGAADEVVRLTGGLLAKIDGHPEWDLERLAELAAALQVFRNAAFVFRQLSGHKGEANEALLTTCVGLIEQGHDHLGRFAGK